jgi:hypothetical protein
MASSIIQKSLDNTLLKFKLPSQTDTDVKLQMVATDSFDDVDEHNDKNALTIFSVGGTTGAPNNASNRWFGFQWINASGLYGLCIAFSFGRDEIYIKRRNNSTTWLAWKTIS